MGPTLGSHLLPALGIIRSETFSSEPRHLSLWLGPLCRRGPPPCRDPYIRPVRSKIACRPSPLTADGGPALAQPSGPA